MTSDRRHDDSRRTDRDRGLEKPRRRLAVTSGPVLLPPRRPSAWARELLAELQAAEA